MSARQHSPLILVSDSDPARPLQPVALNANRSGGGYDEAWIRDLAFAHPQALPVQEIDPSFGPLIPICTELDTRAAGYADALFLNPLGMPTLVECKLWRNPEARREVVGQVLDYARALRRWTYTDLQREAARARKEQGFDLFAHVRDAGGHPDLDQAAFVDGVTRNLAQGRALLLVLGDGIREGVEAIAEYIQGTTGLHFTFGLVEAQVFELGEGRRIVQPRVLARTLIVNRTVVDLAAPELRVVEEQQETAEERAGTREKKPELNDRQRWMKSFWSDLLTGLRLDDAGQPLANPLAESNIFFSMPARTNTWLTCYFHAAQSAIGVFLGMTKTSPVALEIGSRLEADREHLDAQFAEAGVAVRWSRSPEGKVEIAASRSFPVLLDQSVRDEQLAWFGTTINAFVNVLRPRIAALWYELAEGGTRPTTA